MRTGATAYREEYLQEAVEHFYSCVATLHEASKLDFKGRDAELFVPLASCLNTGLAVYKLLSTGANTENEGFMLTRSCLEKLINYLYLRVASDKEYRRYFSYPYYKIYHNGARQVSYSDGLKVVEDPLIKEQMLDSPEVREALSLFSNSDPRLNWSKKTFTERVATVIQKSDITPGVLSLTSFLTYSDASQVLHGTMYGNMLLTGAWNMDHDGLGDDWSAKRVGMNVSKKLTLSLCMLGGVICQTTTLLSKDYGDDELEGKSSRLFDESAVILQKTQKTS